MPVELLEEEETVFTQALKAIPHAVPSEPVPNREIAKKKINWTTTLFMVAFHIGAVAALFMFSWKALIVSAVLYILAINVGIGMGYHRLLTHRGYKTPKWVEYCLAVCGTLSLEGGPIFWVSTHRVHHKHSDKDGDPHTPNDGTWWAHAGWIMHGESLHQDVELANRYAPDLAKDRFHVLLSKYHWVPLVASGVVLSPP